MNFQSPATIAGIELDGPDWRPDSIRERPGRDGCARWAAALVDALGFGIVLAGPDRVIWQTNVAAREVLEAGRGWKQGGGRIEASDLTAGRALRRALEAAIRGVAGYVPAQRDDASAALVLPLDTGADGPCGAWILFETADPGDAGAIGPFARACALTPAEESLLRILVSGVNVGAAASAAGCAEATARAHVRSLLAKTGAATLRALVARLNGLPPLRVDAGAVECPRCDGARAMRAGA